MYACMGICVLVRVCIFRSLKARLRSYNFHDCTVDSVLNIRALEAKWSVREHSHFERMPPELRPQVLTVCARARARVCVRACACVCVRAS